MAKTILIVGASRGIGLGLAKEFKSRGWNVIGTERDRSDDLHALDGVRIETMDVTKPETYSDFDTQLDALIVNAGVYGESYRDAAEASREEVADIMMTNAFGPAACAETLLPLVKDGGTLGLTTSRMGSIDDSSGGNVLYRTSKCAQNMLAKGISQNDADSRGITVLSLHPGWVKTDMGGTNANITVEESARGLADVVEQAGGGGHRFIDYSGKDLPF